MLFVFVNLGQQYQSIFGRMHILCFLPYNTLMISLIVLAVCLLVAQTGDTNELRRLVSVQQWEEQCYDDLVSHCLLVVMPSYGAAEAMKAVEKVANSGENPSFQYFWTA